MAAVDWDLAQRVAARSAPKDPFADSYHYDSLAPDFEELTAIAEKQVAEATGLHSLAGPARARVTDRPGWVSGQHRLVPAAPAPHHRAARRAGVVHALRPGRPPRGRSRDRRAARLDVGPGARPVRPARHRGRGPRGTGHRVLRRAERPRPREALRLPAPRVPAVAGPARGHPPGAVHRHPVDAGALPRARRVDGRARSTPTRSSSSTRSARWRRASAAATTRSTTAASPSCSRSPEQREVLEKVSGLMSLLEGHGDVTMDRAGADQIPNATRFGQVLRQRRQQGNVAVRSCSRSSSASRPSSSSTSRASSSSRRSRAPAAPSSSSGPGSAPRTSPPSGRSATRARGSPGSARPPRPVSCHGARRRRCSPAARSRTPADGPVTCGVSGGADSLALLAPRPPRRAGGHRRPRGPRAAARLGGRGRRRGRRRPQRLGAGFRAVQAVVEPGSEPRGAGPGGSLRGAAARRAHRPHRRRPGRDRPAQPDARVRARRAGRDAPRRAPPAARSAPVRDRGPVRGGGVRARRRPVQPRSALPAQPRPPRAAAAHGRRSRSATWSRCWPARPASWAPTRTCSRRSPPPSTRPTRPRSAAQPPSVARAAVRAWLRPALGGRPPDAATVQRVLDVAAGQAVATEVGTGLRVARTAGRLRLEPAATLPA